MLRPVAALADMCSWNSRQTADRAMPYLPKGAVIQEYCAPCNNTKAIRTVVSTISVKQVNPSYWQVEVNGTGADLAYVYVSGNGKPWTNLGNLVECQDEDDIAKTLSPALVAN